MEKCHPGDNLSGEMSQELSLGISRGISGEELSGDVQIPMQENKIINNNNL